MTRLYTDLQWSFLGLRVVFDSPETFVGMNMWLLARCVVFFRGIFGQPDFRRIVRKNPESYREYGAGIFTGEAAKAGQDKNFIKKHRIPGHVFTNCSRRTAFDVNRWTLLALLFVLIACEKENTGGDVVSTAGDDMSETSADTHDLGAEDIAAGKANDAVSDDADTGAADTTETADIVTDALVYTRCPYTTRTGRFTVDLKETTTSIDGVVANGVVPQNVPTVTLTEGGCSLYYPRSLFCEPACEPGFTCGTDGLCVPYPTNQSVGTVTFSGLSAEVSLNPIPPQQIYYFTGSMPYPGFTAGQPVTLNAAGGNHAPFSLTAHGVTPIVPISTSLPFNADEPATLLWEKAPADSATAVFVTVNLANHGGVPARIECIVADTGELTIASSLVAALLDIGYSGFPTVALSRESVSSTTTDLGCIELVLQSEVVLDVAISGLISCSSSEDCPDGQSCLSDLHCQ
ncbi:MAG: hypothetical protein HUU55_09270 [Myxococcales bacterium]|nr:hypothetical protein [Myxococcales bacterium]